MSITKQQLLATKDRRYGEVSIPELGGSIRIASFTAADALVFKEIHRRRGAGEDVEADIAVFVLSRGLVDGEGQPLITAADAEALLKQISPELMVKLVGEVTRFLAAAPPETAAGNSPGSPSAA